MTNPTEEDWIKLPKEVADAVRGWCLQNGFDGDGRVSYVYAGCALVAITSLLDYQQSKLEEMEKEVARLKSDLLDMTRDRDLWADEHSSDCPNLSLIEAAKVEGFNEGIEKCQRIVFQETGTNCSRTYGRIEKLRVAD